MDLKKLILEKLDKQDSIKSSEIVKESGFSRVYVNRFLKELREEGKIVLIGKANMARYLKAEKDIIRKAKKSINKVKKRFVDIKFSEDIVLDNIKKETGIFIGLKTNVQRIVEYAFTEMFNNAIEHSRSREIEMSMEKGEEDLKFVVEDRGIGIFNNIMGKKKLASDMEAIQELLKGKQTTAPEAHSGEGIFFTSKAADVLTIESGGKQLAFNNKLEDVFIKDIKKRQGTRVVFVVSLAAKRDLGAVFRDFSGDSLEFDRTKVLVKLYSMGSELISRSQGRRIMTSLDKFRHITLDFAKVETVGQAFCDEVFRVWQAKHKDASIKSINTNENIDFMIHRALRHNT